MPVPPLPPERNSYLLRLHSQGDAAHGWRASLQDIRTGEWRHFANLRQLFLYLTEQSADKPTLFAETAVDETTTPSDDSSGTA